MLDLIRYSELRPNDGETIYGDGVTNFNIVYNCNYGFEYMTSIYDGYLYLVSLHPMKRIYLDIHINPDENKCTPISDEHRAHILKIINDVYGGYIPFLKVIQEGYNRQNIDYDNMYLEYGKADIIAAMRVQPTDIPIL